MIYAVIAIIFISISFLPLGLLQIIAFLKRKKCRKIFSEAHLSKIIKRECKQLNLDCKKIKYEFGNKSNFDSDENTITIKYGDYEPVVGHELFHCHRIYKKNLDSVINWLLFPIRLSNPKLKCLELLNPGYLYIEEPLAYLYEIRKFNI